MLWEGATHREPMHGQEEPVNYRPGRELRWDTDGFIAIKVEIFPVKKNPRT